MTDHDILVAGASAPALSDELAAEFSDFNDEQKAMLAESVQLGAEAMGATVAWIRSMRKLRGSLMANCQGNTGWERVCRRVYQIEPTNANAMLRGLDGWEARFLDDSGRSPGSVPISGDPSPTFFRSIGAVKDELRPAVLDALAAGEIPMSSKAVQRKANLLKLQSHSVGLKVLPPPKPPSTTNSPPKPDPKAKGGPAMSRSKYGNLPERDKELNYLKGKHTANEKLADDLTTLMRASATSGSGKIARLQVLAAALHREFKSIGDRYHHSWDHDRHYPSYMTLWQHIWTEEETFNLHAELEAVRKDIAEANRYFSIANMHIYKEGLEVTE